MNSGAKKQTMSGKKPSHRRAILQSQLLELIRAERIQTTKTKARYLKQNFDKLITEAKKSTDASKRRIAGKLQNQKAVVKLYEKILPRLGDRNSGYTRSARTLPRKGDAAEQVIVMIHGAELRDRGSRLTKLLQREQAPKAKTASKRAAKPKAAKSEE